MLMDLGFFFWGDDNVLELVAMAANSVNILETTELYTIFKKRFNGTGVISMKLLKRLSVMSIPYMLILYTGA